MDKSNLVKYADFFRFSLDPEYHHNDDIFIAHPSDAFEITDGVKFVDIVKLDDFELGLLDELKIEAGDNPLNACDYLTNSFRAFKQRNDFLGHTVESFFKSEGSRADILIDRFELVHKNFGAFLDHLLSAYNLFPATGRSLISSENDGEIACNERVEPLDIRLEPLPRFTKMASQ